jgi:hypothetical protein
MTTVGAGATPAPSENCVLLIFPSFFLLFCLFIKLFHKRLPFLRFNRSGPPSRPSSLAASGKIPSPGTGTAIFRAACCLTDR